MSDLAFVRSHVHPSRLDSILGKTGSKTKDSYESKLSLASRIVKVERTVSVTGWKSISIHLIASKVGNCLPRAHG